MIEEPQPNSSTLLDKMAKHQMNGNGDCPEVTITDIENVFNHDTIIASLVMEQQKELLMPNDQVDDNDDDSDSDSEQDNGTGAGGGHGNQQNNVNESIMRAPYRQNHSRPFRNINYFSFIRKSALSKGSFEINGRHNECISRKDNVFYVKNLKFPDCVVRNLCQTYKYQGELWFKPPNQQDDSSPYYDTIYQKIHVELNDFYCFIKPLKEDDIFRKATFFCIADSIKKLNFVKQVKYYGSYSSKTYLPVSDIDLVVYCNMISDELNMLFTIAEKLSYDGIIENKFNIIPCSRIPLLKFHDSLTGFPINITLNTPNVMERSQYLKEHIPPNSHQMKILFFLKYYLLSKGTNQVFYGGIGSYSLALMVIRFFQEESAKELIRSENVFQDSILGYLLMGFLERYGDVNFFKNHIISVQDEGDYIQCDYQYGRNPNSEKKSSVLRIKDHIEPWNDVSYGSFNSAEILKDFQFLHDKFMKADKSKNKSLLGQVLYVVDSFVEYRNLLLYLFRKWFEDYDVKEYMNGRYPSREKYQEFIEKRRIFHKNYLEFSQCYQEDKSLEFKIEHPAYRQMEARSGGMAYFNHYNYHQDDDRYQNYHHRNNNPSSYHRTTTTSSYNNNSNNRNVNQGSISQNDPGLYIVPIDRRNLSSNKIRVSGTNNYPGDQAQTVNGSPPHGYNNVYHGNMESNKRSHHKRSKMTTFAKAKAMYYNNRNRSSSSPEETTTSMTNSTIISMDDDENYNHNYPKLNHPGGVADNSNSNERDSKFLELSNAASWGLGR